MNDEAYQSKVGFELAEVAACMVDPDDARYQNRAALAATHLGPECLSVLPSFLHYRNNPSKPESVANQFNGLGEWMACCQLAAFEIIYHFGIASLPYLRSVAFGEYDWPQGYAVVTLCRLAADGIEHESIVNELNRELPQMRDEAMSRAGWTLLRLSVTRPDIGRVVEELQDPTFQEILSEMRGG